MKRVFILLTAIVSIFLVSCSDDESSESSPIKNGKVLISTNSEDPLLLSVLREDNILVNYYGTKDLQGKAITCNLISVKRPNEADPVFIQIDNEGKPIKINSPNGASIGLNWINSNEIRITATVEDGSAIVNVPIFLDKLGQISKMENTHVIGKKNQRSRRVKFEVNEIPDLEYVNNKFLDQNLSINVERCNSPFTNGFVGLKVIGDNGKEMFFQTNSPNDDGVFNFNIPKPESDIDFEDICSGVDSALGFLCTWVNPLVNDSPAAQLTVCTTISAAIDLALFGPTGEGAYIFASCEVLLNSLNIYCETLGKGPTEGAQSLLGNLCELAEPTEILSNSYSFEPVIYVDGEGVLKQEKTSQFNVNGPFPDINILLSDNPKIANFQTTPLDPAPAQDYVATARIFCATVGTKATISIVGTDGYTDSKIVTLPQGDSEINLTVPGAAQGVLDSLKIEVDGIGTLFASVIF